MHKRPRLRVRQASAGLLLAVVVAACGGGAAAQPPASEGPRGADITITSGALEFDTTTISAPADTGFTIVYVNDGPLPHNVAIYSDESARESVYVGDVIQKGSIVYEVAPLSAGEYFFRCDLHPEMSGVLTVE